MPGSRRPASDPPASRAPRDAARPPVPEVWPAAGDFEGLLDALRGEGASPRMARFRVGLRGLLDRFIPDELLRGDFSARRRARFVVGVTLILLPCYALLVQQLLHNGLGPQAALGAAFAAGTAMALPLLRWTRSHVAPGVLVCVLLIGVIFLQAYADHGLADPILYWCALVPLVAALTVGSRLALTCAALIVGAIGGLYTLTVAGHAFPEATSMAGVRISAVVSVASATLFAMVWGWIYEAQTLYELRALNGRLGRARDALARSEERYRTLFENVPIGIYRTTPDGRTLMANTALLHLLGCRSIEELRALDPDADVYAAAGQRERFMALMDAEGEVRQFVATWRTVDGRRLHVRENARAVRDAAGRPLYYEGTVEDITEQRRVQTALRKSEERFRSLVQHASDVIAVVGADGTLHYASPSVERVLGYPVGAVLGADPLGLVHDADRRRVAVLLRRALGRRGPLPAVEFRVRHAEGHSLYVESVGSSLVHDPDVGSLVLAVRDVTERKRAEEVLRRGKEEAEEMARLKSAFLANMSHEIRTPLTGILGFADVLAEEVTDAQQQQFVGLIAKSGHRLMETLNSVLELARLEAGRVELALRPLPVADAVADAARLLEGVARERGLTLTTELRAPAAQARLDAPAFHRVLVNLIGNALKFTPEGGVTLVVEADDAPGPDGAPPQVRVRVRDTGIGIAPEFLPRLFNEFEQESSGVGRSHEGSGLGLTLTRQLVEHMEGTIAVESVKGEGATFTVAFPRADDAVEAPRPAPAPPLAEGLRLLVVDDNQHTRLLLQRMLRRTAHVDAVATEAEAIAAAAAAPYDAVLLDINLGHHASGQDVLRHLRALPGYGRCPIVAFTAYALPGDRERFLHEGFDGYLAKPFTLDDLAAVLEAARAHRAAGTSGDGQASGPAEATFTMLVTREPEPTPAAEARPAEGD